MKGRVGLLKYLCRIFQAEIECVAYNLDRTYTGFNRGTLELTWHCCWLYSPRVAFCGYSVPHPSENRINVRVQTTGERLFTFYSLPYKFRVLFYVASLFVVQIAK